MRESFLNPFRTKVVNYCFLVFSFAFIASVSVYFVSKIITKPGALLELDGEWRVCVGSECKSTSVPESTDHPFPRSSNFRNLKYSKSFQTPEACLNSSCGILFSEIADAAEVYINGVRVAVHGGLGKDFVFSKHYPVFEAVDPRIFKKNNLIEIFVETAKIPMSGIRGDLNGFYPYKEAKSYVLGRYVYDIFLPLAGALLLLALCLYTIRKIFRAQETRPDLQALAWALSSMALMLVSSSNVPREYLPTWVCAYGHFLIKHGVDWSLFYMAYVFYREKFANLRWMNWWVYFSVAVFMTSVFIAQLFLPAFARENHSVIIPFFAMQILFPLRVLPYLLMLIGCFLDQREKPIGRYASCLVIVAIASFQIADILLSFGLRSGSYYVRFFPVLLGIFYASKIFEIYDEEMADKAQDGENAKGYRRMGMQAAHDLKSPVLALRHQFRKLELTKKETNVVASSLDTIAKITETLERDFQDQREVYLSTNLSQLCANLVSEKKVEFKDKEQLEVLFTSTKDVKSINSFLDPVELKRVLSNLINNSMQAITLEMKGRVELSLTLEKEMACIEVKDNGKGVAQEKIPQLFAKGNSSRRDGKGLGLHHAKEVVASLGGRIEMSSSLGHGTCVKILLPCENIVETKSNVLPLNTSSAKTCVLVDDDEVVADIWQEEAAKANVKLFVYKSPKEASTALVKFDKQNTEFFIDVNFGGERLGADFAKLLKNLGYSKVAISTSYPKATFGNLEKMDIKILGKDSPWPSRLKS